MGVFFVFLFFPLVLGSIGGFLTDSSSYNTLIKPVLSPPGIVFPIVWTILYLLMGISSYLIYKNKGNLKIFYLQLILNSIWTLIFFNLKEYLLSFIWIIILILLVGIMIYDFYKINKKAALIQIPYLLWLIFASYLSYSIYILN